MILVYGIITGILFGVLLQKAEVIRYDKQIGALRLMDMTIVKFMLSAIVVASTLIYIMLDMGMISLSIKGAGIGENIIGGLIFGAGWALVGYCPGTAGGALGEGRWDAAWAMLGMLAGAALYAEAYPSLGGLLGLGSFGKVTLPGVLGVSHWVIIVALWAIALPLFRWFERKGL